MRTEVGFIVLSILGVLAIIASLWSAIMWWP
jgi:hypothetical protein